MFHVFHLQLPSCPHSRVAYGSLAENVTLRRTARTSVRRRNLQTVHAGLFGNEKTDKEMEAHFTMFNRKSGAETDRSAEHKSGENGRASHCKHVLPLFVPYTNLPPDGKALTEEEETCDPAQRSCKVPMYVWERKCSACSGTGFVRSSRSRRGRSPCGICPTCIGMGYVRCTSSRIIPELNNGTGPHFTLLRPKDDDEYEGE